MKLAHATVNVAEDLADFATEQGQDADNDDSNQNKNKCIFDETLAFFLSTALR